MTKIDINIINETHCQIDCVDSQPLRILYDELSFSVPNAKFSPKYKLGKWDGYIRLFNANNYTFPRGLLQEVVNIFREVPHKDYDIRVNGYVPVKEFRSHFDEWLDNLDDLPFKPDEEQREAAYRILKSRKKLIESPTSSGKTFILYLVLRYAIENDLIDDHILLLVPKLYLLEQFHDDVLEYGLDPSLIQKMTSDRTVTSKIVVANWHKIYDQEPEFFEQFGGCFVDECHEATGDSIMKIVNGCVNATFKIGVTGSVKDGKMNELQLRGLFGSVYTTTDVKSMIKSGRAAKLKIVSTLLDYSRLWKLKPKMRKNRLEYASEIEMMTKIIPRDEAVYKLCDKHDGQNILVLFRFGAHGKRMADEYAKRNPGKSVFFINGGVNVKERRRFAKCMDEERGVVIFASLGTTSTGVSIKNIDIGIIAHPVKSKTTVLQMIGRYLRVSKTKLTAIIYDLADDMQLGPDRTSYCRDHAEERLTRYIDAGHQLEEMYIEL